MIVTAPSPLRVALDAALTRYLATTAAPKYLRDAITDADLRAALRRVLATTVPKYLRDAATAWLAVIPATIPFAVA